ncbi:hypothetical protein MMC09_005589 [Bachmanniomyces sp. S44760]|nr:hypothetical protein [Bachmanniomyces sp. S44760]
MSIQPDSKRLVRTTTLEGAENDFFAENAAPKTLHVHSEDASAFIDSHMKTGRRVVLVTSGGTTVPLENQTVRFIDNFSAGTRGATSAEYFLEIGYAVIFLHRQFSLLPYSRHYSHSTNCFLDFMTIGANDKVAIDNRFQTQMQEVLAKYTKVKNEGTLLVLPFTTITEYLWELKETAMMMRPLGSLALFYLAAAVSDFFIPKDKMSEHKIQSSEFGPTTIDTSEGGELSKRQAKKLVIDLDPVPKFLKRLVDGWAPEGMIVSFKLETDPSILIQKAETALRNYHHHLVIGNLLATRKWEVVFVAPGMPSGNWIRVPSGRRKKSMSAAFSGIKFDEESFALPNEPQTEIESMIVPEVAKLHSLHIQHVPMNEEDK